MGYTHYWRRELEIDSQTYKKIVDDFKTLLPAFKVLDIPLADGLGENEPVINHDEVYFNGSVNCGHKELKNLVIPWPSQMVKAGTSNDHESVDGSWFAGVTLNQRTCSGDCSYETFSFPRTMEKPKWGKPENGKWFNFCKTAFRPYDLAVNVFLIIAKHHLGDKIEVSSDGQIQHWLDAMIICENAFGYGRDTGIEF